VNKMKFSRTLFGYSPIEVEMKNIEILAKHESEEKTLLLMLENANSKYNKLIEQNNMLTANIKYTQDSSLYLYNKEIFDNTINHAERNAFFKAEEITNDSEDFVKKVNATMEEIDHILDVLKQEFLAMTSSLDKVIESIITKSEIEDEIATTLDHTLDDLCIHESSMEPFKALDFDAQLSNTVRLDAPALEQCITQQTPSSSILVSSNSNNNVTSISSRTKRPRTVLIAENDSEICALLTFVLEREGFEITLATDAYVLVDMIKEMEAPGIIILDTLLPYMQSNILIKEIKESKNWSDVPILITTSEHNKQVTIEALECGANDSIEKPFNPRELVARVKRLNQSSSKVTSKVGG